MHFEHPASVQVVQDTVCLQKDFAGSEKCPGRCRWNDNASLGPFVYQRHLRFLVLLFCFSTHLPYCTNFDICFAAVLIRKLRSGLPRITLAVSNTNRDILRHLPFP